MARFSISSQKLDGVKEQNWTLEKTESGRSNRLEVDTTKGPKWTASNWKNGWPKKVETGRSRRIKVGGP